MILVRFYNSNAPREEIPAAVGRLGATPDGFIRRGALAHAARAL